MENCDNNISNDGFDLERMTRLELAFLLEKIVHNPDVMEIKDQVTAIRIHFMKLNKEVMDRELEVFLEDGGDKDSYKHVMDKAERRFNAAFGIFKAKRAKQNELIDAQKAANLAKKKAILERAEELLNETSMSRAFKEVKKLHREWMEIGPVPQDKKDEIWGRFKAATDRIVDRCKKQTIKSRRPKKDKYIIVAKDKKAESSKVFEKEGVIGIVDWFEQEKGFGVITSYFDKKEYFVHERSIRRNASTKRLVANAIVLFIPFFDEKRKRESVEDVVVVEDYKCFCQVVEAYFGLFEAETNQNGANNMVSGFVNDVVFPSLIQWYLCSVNKDDTSNMVNELYDIIERYDFPSSFSKQFLIVFLAFIHKSIYQRQLSENTIISICEDLFFKLFDSYDSEIVYEIWNSSKGEVEGEFLIPLRYYLHNHKDFSEYLSHTLVADNVVSFVKQLIELVCRIEREEIVSILKDNNSLITDPDFIASSKGREILDDFYEFVFDEKNEELRICLYKENYIDSIDLALTHCLCFLITI